MTDYYWEKYENETEVTGYSSPDYTVGAWSATSWFGSATQPLSNDRYINKSFSTTIINCQLIV